MMQFFLIWINFYLDTWRTSWVPRSMGWRFTKTSARPGGWSLCKLPWQRWLPWLPCIWIRHRWLFKIPTINIYWIYHIVGIYHSNSEDIYISQLTLVLVWTSSFKLWAMILGGNTERIKSWNRMGCLLISWCVHPPCPCRALGISMIVSFIWIIIMRWLAAPMVWLTLIAFAGLFGFGESRLLQKVCAETRYTGS